MERMVGEVAKRKLYDAAKSGDVAMFKEVLQESPYILDEVSFAYSRNLLHIATTYGQPAIVEELLRINSQLARDLDSKNSSPLHIAAEQGSFVIAQKLLSMAPETLWWRDWHGMNAIHIAAMNGHVEILAMMLDLDSSPAMERIHRGQTVLHLCVKHGQLQGLKVLVKKLGDLVCAKDDDGETILHLAVRSNQLEAIQYLVEVMGVIKKDVRNSMGKTALDILLQIPTISNFSEILRILKKMSRQPIVESVKLSEITLVVVVLISTMAFQVTVNPPGGLWQDDKTADPSSVHISSSSSSSSSSLSLSPASSSSLSAAAHRAGEAIMASTNFPLYRCLMCYNTLALLASLVTVFLIITGLSSRHHYFLLTALVAVWVSVSSIVCSCVASMLFVSNPGSLLPHPLAMWGINVFIYTVSILPICYLLLRKS